MLIGITKTKIGILDIKIMKKSEKFQAKVTNIMGPLSKIWLMLEKVNSAKDGEASFVHMNELLELREKSVVLFRQCRNIIINKRKKILSWG